MQVGKTERERDMLEREREMMSVPGTGTCIYVYMKYYTCNLFVRTL